VPHLAEKPNHPRPFLGSPPDHSPSGFRRGSFLGLVLAIIGPILGLITQLITGIYSGKIRLMSADNDERVEEFSERIK